MLTVGGSCGGAGVETPSVALDACFGLERPTEGGAWEGEEDLSSRSGALLFQELFVFVVSREGFVQTGSVFPGCLGLGCAASQTLPAAVTTLHLCSKVQDSLLQPLVLLK